MKMGGKACFELIVVFFYMILTTFACNISYYTDALKVYIQLQSITRHVHLKFRPLE
jgi:hypothetical protein